MGFVCSTPVTKNIWCTVVRHQLPPCPAHCTVLYFAIQCLILTSGFSILSYLQGHSTISQQDSTWKIEQKLWAITTLMVPEGLSQLGPKHPRPQPCICLCRGPHVYLALVNPVTPIYYSVLSFTFSSVHCSLPLRLSTVPPKLLQTPSLLQH